MLRGNVALINHVNNLTHYGFRSYIKQKWLMLLGTLWDFYVDSGTFRSGTKMHWTIRKC